MLAGGAESMSGATYYSQAPRWGTKAGGFQMKDALAEGRVHAGGKDHPVWGGMIETAENVRKRYSIGREEQDRWRCARTRRRPRRSRTAASPTSWCR